MTQKTDRTKPVKKLVVVLDICSSTHLIEDLLKNQRIRVWKNLLIDLKEYLDKEVRKAGIAPHKFTGDGWILLADDSCSGKLLFEVLSMINRMFEKKYAGDVAPCLDTPPEIYGITFGLDEGALIRIVMNQKEEYIGRPINVACRLQGKIEAVDIKGGFRGLMSNRLYHSLETDLLVLQEYDFQYTERSLRNLSSGAPFGCYLFAPPTHQFRITEAKYGTSNNTIDVTRSYIEHVKNGRLDVKVTNDLAGNDPDSGVQKELHIKYMHEGKKFERTFKEDAQIQLP